jgi:hypothetical protein
MAIQESFQGKEHPLARAVILGHFLEPLLDVLELRRIHDQVLAGRQVLDLTEGTHDPLEEGRMSPKEAGGLHVAFLAGHLVKEGDKPS